MTRYEDLNSRQVRAINALMTEPTQERAADAAGVSVSTLVRWRRSDAFRQALIDAEADAIGDAVRRFAVGADIALERLERLVRSDDDGIALRSIQTWLEHWRRLHELANVESRLSELTQRLAALEAVDSVTTS